MRRSKSIAMIALAALAAAACTTTVDSGAPRVRIVIHGPDGDTEQELGTDELRMAVSAAMPAFRVDEAMATDPSWLLVGERFELPRPGSMERIRATRSGNALHADGIEISWNTDRTRLQVGPTIAVDVDGLASSRDRDRLVGRLIATFLGADTGATEFISDGKADFGITLAVILAVSYLGCVTSGNLTCSNVAHDNCPTGVDAYTMVCGAGYNVDGDFELGMSCSFRCRP